MAVASASPIPDGPPAPYGPPPPAYKPAPAPYHPAPYKEEKLPPQPFAYQYGVTDTYSSAQSNETESPESLQNIPAFLPYEAKQALLRELSRSDRKLPVNEMNDAAEILEEVEEAEDSKSNFDHFFYPTPIGNSPTTNVILQS